MLRTTLRSLWSHKRRLISTCVAIVLGVAFIAGTLVLNGTVGKIFDDLFADIGKGIDAQVRGPKLFKDDQGGNTIRDRLDDSVIAKVQAVPGVAAAEGSVMTTSATLVDSKGDAMGGTGPPVIVGSWDTDKQLASYQVVKGKAPAEAGQAVIDVAGAEKGGFEIGDKVRVITGTKEFRLTLVGETRFGDADSAGGTVYLATTLEQAQEIVGEPGKIDQVNARAVPGVSPEQLVERIKKANVAKDADIVTGKQASEEQASDIKNAFGFFTMMLTIFALIALFVGWFIISNTFSILVAQRTRELALLRAIGATRSQVLGSVMVEATIIGLISGIVGLGVGIALAFGGFAALRSGGVDLPSAGLVVPPSAIVVALVAGLFVTLIAAIMPAIRATRVPPIAALRDVALDTSGSSKIRAGIGVLLLLAGAFFARDAFASVPTNDDIQTVGIGVALILVAVLVLGPVLAAPLARALGSWIPAVKGITGKLSRQNAMRSPRRTASTAAALLIGVALIVFITVFAQSATSSINSAIGNGFKGDYIVMPTNQFGGTGAPPALASKLRDLPDVAKVSELRATMAQIQIGTTGDKKVNGFVGGIDPASASGIFQIQMSEGSLSSVATGGLVVDRAVAKQNDLAIGDSVTILAATGRSYKTTVTAISNDPAMLGQWTLSLGRVAQLDPESGVFMAAVKLSPGVTVDAARPELRKVVKAYPQMKLQDREQFKAGIVSTITSLLKVVYVLLLVSIVISMIGISNTLSLSIHERTRELGLLRAMGMTRSQLRSSVRWEAVIVAMIGTLLGIVLGVGLSYLMVKALSAQGITDFAAPPVALIAIAGIAALLAIVASLRPAWKASKLNILEAISTD
jgi:putative ABC transport system permease protein